jgi:hypothetical protein
MKDINFKPSLPPPDHEIPDQLFEYLPPPAPMLRMKPGRATYRFLMARLSYLAERAKEYAKLPADHPDRVCFEYRQQIMVELCRVDNAGLLDLDNLKFTLLKRQIRQSLGRGGNINTEEEKLREREAIFQDAVLKAIDDLGIVL